MKQANTTTLVRHCGLDPQSTGWLGNATLSTCWIRPWRKLVLALRQYPQGGARQQDNTNQHRHVIADLIRNPEGQGVTQGNNKTD